MKTTRLLLAAAASVVLSMAEVPQWPQFRGPGGAGVGPEDARLPVEFGRDSNLLWKAPAGIGHGSVCIWGNYLFLTSYSAGAKRLELVALDRTTGKELWRRAIVPDAVERVHSISNLATSTPATDGERVYAYFGAFGLAAFTLDGKPVWEHRLPVATVAFGSGTSPVVHAGTLFLSYGGKPAPALYALNTRDGSLKWKAPLRPSGTALAESHSTAFIWDASVIMHNAKSAAAHDLRDGSERWWLPTNTTGTATPAASANLLYIPGYSNAGDSSYLVPLPAWIELLAKYDSDNNGSISQDELGNDLYVVKRPELSDDTPSAHVTVKAVFRFFDPDKSGSIGENEWEEMRVKVPNMIKPHGFMAIKPGGQGDITATHVAWIEQKNLPEVPSPVLYRGRLYLVSNGGIVSSLDATDGRVIFRGRLGAPGEYYASPVAAGGRVYLSSRNGVVTVIEHGDALKVLGRNDLKEDIFATPAIAGDVLYVRTASHVLAFRSADLSR